MRVLRVPLNGLSLISAIAPLLGLLGTVIGIVTCFDTIAYEAASASKSQALASGIRVALFTTVGGLTVTIPAQVTLFISNLKLTTVVSECEFIAEPFLHEVALIKRADQPAPVVMAAAPVVRKKRRSPPVPASPITESVPPNADTGVAPKSVTAAESAADAEPVAAVPPDSGDPSETSPETPGTLAAEPVTQVVATQSESAPESVKQSPAVDSPPPPSKPNIAPAAGVSKPARGKSKKAVRRRNVLVKAVCLQSAGRSRPESNEVRITSR